MSLGNTESIKKTRVQKGSENIREKDLELLSSRLGPRQILRSNSAFFFGGGLGLVITAPYTRYVCKTVQPLLI